VTLFVPGPRTRARHFTLTWALDIEHGGMTSALLRRSGMFARAFGQTVTILTFDPVRDYTQIRAGLDARGVLPDGVGVLNLWDWLAERGGAPASPRRMSHRYSADGTRLLQIDHLRADGSVAVSDERDAPVRGRRRVRLYDRDGSVVREWRTAWALYAFWLDALRAGARAVMIADSKPAARFLATYRRREVLTAHVMHGSHLDADGRDFSASRRPVVESIDDYDLVVLLTRQQRADLELRIGRRGHVRVIPNAVDPVAHPLANPARNGGVVLASLGARKRVEHAVQAVADARRLGVPAELDIYGDGPRRRRVAQLAQRTDGVRLHGFQPGASAALRDRSFLLLTSTSEGSPLCVLEALAAGCLPIAYDIPFGPADVIRDGVNGFLVPAGDTAAMAARIAALHAMPSTAVDLMRRRAVATVSDYEEDAVLAAWRRELRRAWHRKSGVIPRARRVLRRRFTMAA
jgi:poly(glycerol-phosphate) alpha-glucosyltransferase